MAQGLTRRLRPVIAALCAAWLVAVTDHAFADLTGGPWIPGTDAVVRAVGMRQSWEMFRNPGRIEDTAELWGLRTDRSGVLLVAGRRPLVQPWLAWPYDHQNKIQRRILADEAGRERWALAACALDPQVVAVRVVRERAHLPGPGEPRSPKRKRTTVGTYPCPR